jgi:hypothetical protein
MPIPAAPAVAPAYAVPDRATAWGAGWITNAFPEDEGVIRWAARRLGVEIVTGPAHDAHGEPCPELVEVRAPGVEWTAQLDDAFWTLFRDGGGSGAASMREEATIDIGPLENAG